jgi:hypothetical protein
MLGRQSLVKKAVMTGLQWLEWPHGEMVYPLDLGQKLVELAE